MYVPTIQEIARHGAIDPEAFYRLWERRKWTSNKGHRLDNEDQLVTAIRVWNDWKLKRGYFEERTCDQPVDAPRVATKAAGPKKVDSFRAIATAYRQYEFRSRLEAKWAAFFDLCKWSWSYEPYDFNGWIPDFAIGERPVLVEIKPFFKHDQWQEQKVKIISSGCRQPVVLLGADPVWLSVEAHADHPGSVYSESPTDAPIIGWLFEPNDGEHTDTWHLHFGFTEGNNKLGLCPMDGPWRNVIWKWPNESRGDSWTGKWARVDLRNRSVETELVERWANACNVSKWVPLSDRK